MLSDVLRNFVLFVNGGPMVGECEEITPPKLTIKTEEIRNGGMDAPVEIDMGMEKLEATFVLTKFDSETVKLLGFVTGGTVQVTAKGSIGGEFDGDERPVVLSMTGKLKEVDSGSWKAGDLAKKTYLLSLTYYKETVDGVDAVEIDVLNMIRKIDGIDQLETRRANLGI